MVSSATTAIPHEPACGNPYQILSVPKFSTSPRIKKAFRALSLKLHPDKRRKNLSPAEIVSLDNQFHDMKLARSFLLDEEYSSVKLKYDAALESSCVRREEEETRERHMSANRLRMRVELEKKLQHEQQKKEKDNNFAFQRGGATFSRKTRNRTDDLKNESNAMREAFNERVSQETERKAAGIRKKTREELEWSQVRLKWSRNKLGYQTEKDLIFLLSKSFGEVKCVELIGNKGNAALVTFRNKNSCELCVVSYSKSDEMRAFYIGKRKEEFEKKVLSNGTLSSMGKDRESVEERKLRQAAEREKILRQMELEDMGNDSNKPLSSIHSPSRFVEKLTSENESDKYFLSKNSHTNYPPQILSSNLEDESNGRTSFERLQNMERIILKDLISPKALHTLQQLS